MFVLVILIMIKSLWVGKVFVDWSQNSGLKIIIVLYLLCGWMYLIVVVLCIWVEFDDFVLCQFFYDEVLIWIVCDGDLFEWLDVDVLVVDWLI